MANVIVNKREVGVLQVNKVKSNSKTLYVEFVDTKVGVSKALKKALGNKNSEAVVKGLEEKSVYTIGKLMMAFFNKEDERNQGDIVIDNLIKTKLDGAVVVGIDAKGIEKLEARKMELPNSVAIMVADVVYDGYTRKANAKDGELLFGFRNDFEYEEANVYAKKITFKNDVEIKELGNGEFKSYGHIESLSVSTGKKQIKCPVIERALSKDKDGNTVLTENCFMDNRSESWLARTMGYKYRIAKKTMEKNTVMYDVKVMMDREINVNYNVAYVDLTQAPQSEKDMVAIQAYADTEHMVNNGFYAIVLRERVTNSKGTAVLDERESIEYFLTKEEALKAAELSGAEVIRYEVAMASQSQSMNNKATFVNSEFMVSENIVIDIERQLSKKKSVFGVETEIDALYPEYIRSLRGRAAMIELSTAFAFGVNMSNEFINWVARTYPEIDIARVMEVAKYDKKVNGSGVTANIRFAMALTNSNGYKPEGGVEVNPVGSVKYILTQDLADELTAYYNMDEETLKKAWKAEKLDGQSIVRKSFMVKALKALGMNKEVGAVQSRTISQKGMVLVVNDDIYEAVGYTGDVTVEGESYKYDINELAQDMFEISIVNREKGTMKCRLNQQYINALGKFATDIEGNTYNDISSLIEDLKVVVDKYFDELEVALEGNDIVALLKLVGLYASGKELSIEDLDMEAGNVDTKTALAVLVAGTRAMQDGYIKAKTYELAKGAMGKLLDGGILVDGAVKYIVSDPTAMLRTDLMARKGLTDGVLVNAHGDIVATKNEEGKFIAVNCVNGTVINEGDIVISSKEQVALRGVHDCLWVNSPRTGKALTMRTPKSHEGEPQLIDLLALEDVERYITMLDKDGNEFKLDTWDILSATPDTLMIGGFNVILEALGGADTDGDRVHIILDEMIVALRPSYQDIPPCIVEAGNSKKAVMEMSFNMIPEIILGSLRDDYTGVLTNTNTRIIDIRRILQYVKATNSYKFLRLADGLVDTILSIQEKAIEALMDEELFYDFDQDGKLSLDAPLTEEREIATEWSSIVISQENLDYLIDLCGRTSVMFKRLQEKAIGSAKTGIYVRFEAVKFLRGDGRMPYWFTPGKERTRYNTFIEEGDKVISLSPMDAVFRRVLERYEAIDKKVYRDASEFASEFDYDYMPEFDMYDDMHFDVFEGEDELPKSIAFSVSEELAKVKYASDSKMRIHAVGLDINEFKKASEKVSKLGEEYKASMKKIFSIKNKARKQMEMDSLISKARETLLVIEDEFGFTNTYMAAYNPSDVGAKGQRLSKVSTSFAWIVCPDKLFMLLNSAFKERHGLLRKEDALKRGLSFTEAFNGYVAVNMNDATNEIAMAKEAELEVYGEEFTFSMYGINKKYATTYTSAKDALLTNFKGLNGDVVFDIVIANDVVELHNGNTPVFTMVTSNCSLLSKLAGKKVSMKLTGSQKGNFGTNGKSVVVEVTGIL